MTEIAIDALLNFATLSLYLVVLVGSAVLCMFVSDRTIGNPFAGLGVWAFAFMVIASIGMALR